jgi:hypothetical protein
MNSGSHGENPVASGRPAAADSDMPPAKVMTNVSGGWRVRRATMSGNCFWAFARGRSWRAAVRCCDAAEYEGVSV